MNHDKFIGSYVSSVKSEIQKLKNDLATTRFKDMYQLGDLQGRILGLESSLELLEAVYADQDN